MRLKIDWQAWEMPAIFKLIQNSGNITDDEMRNVFNLGIGLVAVVSKKEVKAVFEISKKMDETPYKIGEVV
jgi:phosphoribosylformylglycinamidine cyclo-ligase